MQVKDYYEILGIRATASADEIALAYKGRRTQYHPDKYSQLDSETQNWSTVKMQEVNEAYATLSDVNLRKVYDATYEFDGVNGKATASQEEEQGDQSESWHQGQESSNSLEITSAPLFFKKLQDTEELANTFLKKFNEIAMITEPAIDWKSIQVQPPPLSAEFQELVDASNTKRRYRNVVIALGALVVIIFPHSYIAWIIFISLHGLFFFNNPTQKEKHEKEKFQKIVDIVDQEYKKEVKNWNSAASGQSALNVHKSIDSMVRQHLSYISEVRAKLLLLTKTEQSNQLQLYLENILLTDRDIPGVGRTRKAALSIHGIYSVADIQLRNFKNRDGYKIPGFNESLVNSLLGWREQCEQEFEPDFSTQSLTDSIAPLQKAFFDKNKIFNSAAASATRTLQERTIDTLRQRDSLQEHMQQIALKRAQAEGDLRRFGGNSLSIVLLAVIWIIVGGVTVRNFSGQVETSPQLSSQSDQSVTSPALPVAALPIVVAAQPIVPPIDSSRSPSALDSVQPSMEPMPNPVAATTVESSGVCQGLNLTVAQDQLACLDKKFTAADMQLNDDYKQVMAKLDSSGKAALKSGQLRWIKEKETKCARTRHESTGEPLNGIQAIDCKLQMTEQRLAYLGTLQTANAAQPASTVPVTAQVAQPPKPAPLSVVSTTPNAAVVKTITPETTSPSSKSDTAATPSAAAAPSMDGDWNGPLACGPALLNPAARPAYTVNAAMRVSGNKAESKSQQPDVLWSMSGTIDPVGNLILSGTAMQQSNSATWALSFSGSITGKTFTATGTVRSLDGKTVYRNCKLTLTH